MEALQAELDRRAELAQQMESQVEALNDERHTDRSHSQLEVQSLCAMISQLKSENAHATEKLRGCFFSGILVS